MPLHTCLDTSLKKAFVLNDDPKNQISQFPNTRALSRWRPFSGPREIDFLARQHRNQIERVSAPRKMNSTLLKIVFVATISMPQSLLACPLVHPDAVLFLKEAVTGEWHSARYQSVAAFVCCADTWPFLREWQFRTPVQISTPKYWHETLANIVATEPREQLTYIVDVTCPQSESLLYQAGKNRLLKIPNRWILMNLTQTPGAENPLLDPLSSDIESSAPCRDRANDLALRGPGFKATKATDSDVTLVCRLGEKVFNLVDMWDTTTLGFWHPEKGFQGDHRPPSGRRIAVGLNGYEMKVGIVLSNNDSLRHMMDGKIVKSNLLTIFFWEMTKNVMKMLNASAALRVTNDYGYFVNGTWTGLTGLQYRGEVEMIGTGLALIKSRMAFIRYTNFYLPARGVFIFRAPPMSYEHNIFIEPFPLSLWLASIGIVFLCAVFLYAVLKIELILGMEQNHSIQMAPGIIISEGRKRRLEASWTDVAILAVGAVCQQGSPVEARGFTGRTITLVLFIGILFLYVSYSASIIALLQSTSTSIKSIKDLLEAKIKVGAESTSYNVEYMKNFQDPVRRSLFEKKIKRNLMTVQDGVKRVRTSYFAFHTIPSLMYEEISNTFQEHEKCGLMEVGNYLLIQDPMLTITKSSENMELILKSWRRQLENGIHKRQVRKYLALKPVCTEKGSNFQSVALIDCGSVFIVLGIGLGISSLLLLIETLVYRYHLSPDRAVP